MAGKINGVEVFDRTLRNLQNEMLPQAFDKFNQMSNGGLILNGTTPQGDYDIDVFVKNIADAAHYRRDVNSTGTVTPVAYDEQNIVKVKVAGGFFVEVPNAILMWASSGANPTPEISAALGKLMEQYIQKRMGDQLNTSIACLGAAIEANAGVLNDLSAGGETVDQIKMNTTRGLFGDRRSAIVAWVMHSGAYTQLGNDAIANANALDTVGGVMINKGSVQAGGLPIVVTDDPALAYNDGTRDVYKIIGVVSGGSVVTNVKEISTADTATGNENIKSDWQVNYDFTAGIKGYSWDTTNGGQCPTDAELATGTNWDKVVSSDKDTAGVALIVPQVATP